MIPAFPLGSAFLPGDRITLRVFEERYVALVEHIMEGKDPAFVTVLIERGSEVGGGERRFGTGVMVRLESVSRNESGISLTGVAGGVVLVTSWGEDDPYPQAEVEDVHWENGSEAQMRDCASALTLLAQSVRSLLARHGIDSAHLSHPYATALATVAAGQWFSASVPLADVERAFWAVARCVPCGPLDRHRFLCVRSAPEAVRALRAVVEHTDEILSFGLRDQR